MFLFIQLMVNVVENYLIVLIFFDIVDLFLLNYVKNKVF